MTPVYVSGHRNPDTDSIGSAIGYAELKSRLDPNTEYVPVRLGEVNPQTRWVLEQAGATAPQLLPHIRLRAGDLMQTEFPRMRAGDPIREAGLALDHTDYDLVPVVDDDGVLIGIITTRSLARRYVRESRSSSTLREATYLHAVVDVLDGELLVGEDRALTGRIWVHASSVEAETGIDESDIVVIGDRPRAQLHVLERELDLLVIANGGRPAGEVLEIARQKGTAVVISPLDTYVAARMITLAAPCRELMENDQIVASTDELISDVSEQIKDSHHGAAIVCDDGQHPIGLLTRSDLVSPMRRRVILVDHAEQAQSVPGIDQAEIVEILDHHHIGSIETKVPVAATFDPVGSTSTLVVERFRRSGIEPSHSTAMVLLSAVLSDTVVLGSPTTTDRDEAVVDYLERVLELDAREYGRRMFVETSDVSGVAAEVLVTRDAKAYQSGSGTPFVIAQVEVVGKALLDREQELIKAMAHERASQHVVLYALMVTDVLDKVTDLLIDGDVAAVARVFGVEADGCKLRLPGVMSRKKQVAPKLLSAV
ncbi:MAG TPA: putative manganese-dependent inorganic diphosphatase [Solirubrobacteraceae bacterium]|nr:putative manganese-dependent inorganic diphosphatase [Solirubrobacteraceae bacterium]